MKNHSLIRHFLVVLLLLTGVGAAFGRKSACVVDVAAPSMKVFLPSKDLATGQAIVVCPGGGYRYTALDSEGYYWAPFFNDIGVAVAVVDYTMPAHDRSLPMNDIAKAFEVLADSAAVWGIDPAKIGIMGSSAGGHLAATMCTCPESTVRPAFQLLFYPVISFDEKIAHGTSRKLFLPEDADDAMRARFSCDNNVGPHTPPAFIVHCGDDKVVPVEHTLRYYRALLEYGIPATLAIYPEGGHGFGYRLRFKKHDLMKAQITDWLKSL